MKSMILLLLFIVVGCDSLPYLRIPDYIDKYEQVEKEEEKAFADKNKQIFTCNGVSFLFYSNKRMLDPMQGDVDDESNFDASFSINDVSKLVEEGYRLLIKEYNIKSAHILNFIYYKYEIHKGITSYDVNKVGERASIINGFIAPASACSTFKRRKEWFYVINYSEYNSDRFKSKGESVAIYLNAVIYNINTKKCYVFLYKVDCGLNDLSKDMWDIKTSEAINEILSISIISK